MSLKPEVIRGNELTLDTFLAGLSTVPATVQFTVNGEVFTQPQLVKKVEEVRAPFKKVRDLDAQLKVARTELNEEKPDISLFVKALNTTARAYVGENNPDITKFGFKPDKAPRHLTAEESAARAAKMRATRAARHTMGRRQKQAVHGAQTPDAKPAKDEHAA